MKSFCCLLLLATAVRGLVHSHEGLGSTASLDMYGNELFGLPLPSRADGAATRAYVDAASNQGGLWRQAVVSFTASSMECDESTVVVTDFTQVTCRLFLRTTEDNVAALDWDASLLQATATQGDGAQSLDIAHSFMFDETSRTFNISLEYPTKTGEVRIYVSYFDKPIPPATTPLATFSVLLGPLDTIALDHCDPNGASPAYCYILGYDALGNPNAGENGDESQLEFVQFVENGVQLPVLPDFEWVADGVFRFVVAPFGLADASIEVGVVGKAASVIAFTATIQPNMLGSNNAWAIGGDSPERGWWYAIGTYRGAVYAFGGAYVDALVRRYSVGSNSWTTANLDAETGNMVWGQAAAQIGHLVYLCGAWNNNLGSDVAKFDIYNMATESYELTDGTAPEVSAHGSAAAIGTDVYWFTKSGNVWHLHTTPSPVWDFTVMDTFSSTYPTVVAVGSYIYFMSGDKPLGLLHRFGPSAPFGSRWMMLATSDSVRYSSAGFVVNAMPCWTGGNGDSGVPISQTTDCWNGSTLTHPIDPLPNNGTTGGAQHAIEGVSIPLPDGTTLLVLPEGYDYGVIGTKQQDTTRLYHFVV